MVHIVPRVPRSRPWLWLSVRFFLAEFVPGGMGALAAVCCFRAIRL